MAEKYRFFDAVQDEHGQYDREYNAQEFTDYFKALVTTGVMKGTENELAVVANGSNMITTVNTGIAFLLGRYYENDSPLPLTHDTETLGNSRIDRIVIRMDLSTEARYVRAFIKKGVPSTNPVPPTLTQTPNLYEISLAQVKIVGGQTFIATNAVTDERGKDVVCPWAGSNILPNFDNQALEDLINKIDNLDPIPKGLITMWSGSITNIPTGWALCNGQNGTPNLTDRFMVAAGGKYNVGSTGGADSVTLTTAQIPSHSHGSGTLTTSTDGSHTHVIKPSLGYLGRAGTGAEDMLKYYSGTTTSTETGGAHSHSISGTTSNAGNGNSHENRPPYYALAYIMKL